MSTPNIEGRGVLGETGSTPSRELDTFELPETTFEVSYTSDEVTSLCPITGAPDYYTVSVDLRWSVRPERAKKGIESKSLKLYLQSFRDEGNFCEAFADIIANDVQNATEASWVTVTVIQKPRGGVSIKAVSEVGG